jgi:hypothetical protein
MQKIFRSFDLFSQSPSLKINGGSKASTNFGALVGFITIIILLSGIIFIINDYFNGLSFKINSFIDNTYLPNIDLRKVKIGFHLLNYNSKEFKQSEKIFSLKARLWNFQRNHDDIAMGIPEADYEEIKLIKCDQYKNNIQFNNELDRYSKIYKDLICLDMENLGKNLTGIYGFLGKYL